MSISAPEKIAIRPPLKWAGNKFLLLDKIKKVLGENATKSNSRLIEPFLGSGSIFLNTDYNKYLLGDTNKDLINLYQQLKKYGNKFITYCEDFFNIEYNNKEYFLNNRNLFNNTNFNNIKNRKLRAALFIYLNKHSFNGLCRFNSSGEFNVSFGSYKKPYFPKKELIYFSQKLQSAELINSNFTETMSLAKPGDIIYCDPPYVPLSDTAYFTSYNPDQFTIQDQEKLVNLAEKLSKKNIPVIISNHDLPYTRKLYNKAKIISFDVQRNISCKGDSRNKVKELLAIFS